MSSEEREPWYAPGYRLDRATGQRQPREEVWRLRHVDGRVLRCELRNDSETGAGWDVVVFNGEELAVSHRCVDEPGARFYANATRQDNLRGGWIEDTEGPRSK